MSTGPSDLERAATERADADGDGAQTQPRGDGPIVVQRHSIGRFRIDAELGSGGMADVYRAYDPVLDRAVALKVLHTRRSDDDTQGMRRVLREARAAAALTHPNTVTIFEVGEAQGEVFIAMELLEGSVLREVLDHGKASLEEKLRWLLQAARALAAAHDRGLVHRDVKPENMFVCADGSLKLLDFGIAKRDEDESHDGAPEHVGPSSLRTQAGRRLGTPRYMAPEQHAGQATDARTDEYAWGLVAFELLCGSLTVAEQTTVTSDGGAAPAGASPAMRLAELRLKVPELPEAIAAAVARALEPDKADRFPSMQPIVAALEAKITTEAPARSSSGRMQPRWWIVAAAAALSAIAMAGLLKLRRIAQRADETAAASATAAVSPRGALAPACRTVSTRFLQMGPRDQIVAMANGTIVFARDPARGLLLELETPQGLTPLLRPPVPLMPGYEITDLRVQATLAEGIPSVAVVQRQVEISTQHQSMLQFQSSLMLVGDNGRPSIKRVGGGPEGFATTSFGRGVVTVVTASFGDPREELPPGIAVHVLGGPRVVPIEGGVVHAPAVAATRSRLGIAYQHAAETHFALLDEDLKRVGDIKAMPLVAESAVAFSGAMATLFWTAADSGKTRLAFATLTPGDATFAAPQMAIDEPLVNARPITARLPDGSFAVAWLTSDGGAPTLRVSPVGERGALTGPSNVSTDGIFRDLAATSTPRGIDFSWHDGAGGARVAHVTCQPPTSRPDR